jgi:hypothetical protein
MRSAIFRQNALTSTAVIANATISTICIFPSADMIIRPIKKYDTQDAAHITILAHIFIFQVPPIVLRTVIYA